jgi:hypothetical protein
MFSHLAIATACADSLERSSAWDLLGLSGKALARFEAKMKRAACIDLQVAMDQAWESGEVGLLGEQMAMRIAA